MSTSTSRYPLTIEQKAQLHQDLALIQEKLQEMAMLMHASYGEESQAAIRADETAGALQRFIWEWERMRQTVRAAVSCAV